MSEVFVLGHSFVATFCKKWTQIGARFECQRDSLTYSHNGLAKPIVTISASHPADLSNFQIILSVGSETANHLLSYISITVYLKLCNFDHYMHACSKRCSLTLKVNAVFMPFM